MPSNALIVEAPPIGFAGARRSPVETALKSERRPTGDDTAEAMLMLRQSIEDLADRETAPPSPHASQANTSKMLLEILLLLRAVADPSRVRAVQSALKRQGVAAWDGHA